MVNIGEMQRIFFEAMRNSWVTRQKWAKNTRKTTIPELPGSKAYIWEDGAWRVVDSYFVGPQLPEGFHKKKSAGSTIIFYEGLPVWFMYYGGFYPDEAIPFLKRALYAAYSRNEFFGGRGPLTYKDSPDGALIYSNQIVKNSFEGFEGREEIRTDDKNSYFVGWHDYGGLALV